MKNIEEMDFYGIILHGWTDGLHGFTNGFFSSYPTRDQIVSLLLTNFSLYLSNSSIKITNVRLIQDPGGTPALFFRRDRHDKDDFIAVYSIRPIKFLSSPLETYSTNEHSEIRKLVKGYLEW